MLSEQEIEGLKDDFRGSRVVDENGFAEWTMCSAFDEGVSVIITNTTVTVTNSPVDIEEGEEGSDTASIAAGTSADDEEVEEVGGGTGIDNSDDEETNNDIIEDDA